MMRRVWRWRTCLPALRAFQHSACAGPNERHFTPIPAIPTHATRMSMKDELSRSVRLDLWLWAARFEIDVLGLSEKRGPASIAQQHYAETESSRLARAHAVENRRLENAGYAKPPTKPDKRARRLIHALGDIDAF
jgi:hypothetical protein